MSTDGMIPHWQIDAAVTPAMVAGLPELARVDVLVVGGGAAGVAAATVAAEAGCITLLVERYGFCGGAAVAGMSGTICGLYLASEMRNQPEQVVFGFTERFRARLAARGGLTRPQIYGKTFTVTHDPLMWRETADDFLREAGVRILFHTALAAPIVDNGLHLGAVLDSNAGRSVVWAARTVDASGDAAVVARAGLSWTFGDRGVVQNPTMFFRLGGVDLPRYVAYWGDDTICPPKVTEAIAAAQAQGRILPRNKIWVFPTTRPGELLVNATRLTAADGRMLNVLDPEDFTIGEIDGRRQVREYARFFRDTVPGCEDSYVIDTGIEVGIRQTRSVVGAEKLHNDDVVACRKRDDGICRVPWPIELHTGEKPKLHWLLDDWYEVPYHALVPQQGENLIVAGRCLSAEHEALASARVTAQCFEYGHAAGAAAALSIAERVRLRDLPVGQLRRRMRTGGSAL